MTSKSLDQAMGLPEKTREELCEEIRDLRMTLAKYEALEHERHRTERALRESETNFRALCENANDTIMRFDRQFRHLYVNSVVEEQTGIPPQDFIGKTHEELGFPEDKCRLWKEAIQKAFDEKKEHRIEFMLPTGIWIDWLLIPEFGLDGNVSTVLTSARDITERKIIELELQQERNLLEMFMNTVPDHIYFKDREGMFTHANRAQAAWMGVNSPEELMGKTDYDFFSKEHADQAREDEKRILRTGEPLIGKEERETRPDGKVTWVVTTKMPLYDNENQIIGTFGVSRDITEQKYAQEALRQSEQKYRLLADNVKDVIWTMDMDLRFTYISPAILHFRKLTPEEASQLTLGDTLTPESYQRAMEVFAAEIERERKGENDSERSITLELEQVYYDGDTRWTEATMSFLRDEAGQAVGILGVTRDIGERKKAEQDLRESEERYRRLTENAQDLIWRCSLEGAIEFVNAAVESLLGYRVEEALGLAGQDYLTPDSLKMLQEWIFYAVHAVPPRDHFQGELKYIHKDNREILFDAKITMIRNEDGRIAAIEGVSRDMTERNEAEQALRESEERYRAMVESASDIIYETDVNGFFTYANPVAERFIGYKAGEMTKFHFTKFIRPDFRDPVARFYVRQFRKKNPSTYNEFPVVNKDGKELWFGQNVQLTFEGEKVAGFQAQARDITDRRIAEDLLKRAHDELEKRVEERTSELSASNVRLLQEIHQRRRTQIKLQESLAKYQRAMEGIIRAMALTVEMRDPYTAGHQQRVTELACAIARKMNLEQDQIDGIRMAGIIHDLGKISIPAEILSKPGELSDIVFDMIKIHPQVGYEILKSIDFPWPVAQIVLQHHERIDGSGYPNGLTGDQLLIESKILMVADVFEAVSSHRPYRPALGREAAMEELLEKSGTLYDPEVVEACEKVIRAEGFDFNYETKDLNAVKDYS